MYPSLSCGLDGVSPMDPDIVTQNDAKMGCDLRGTSRDCNLPGGSARPELSLWEYTTCVGSVNRYADRSQDDCKVRWHGHRGGRWSGWGGRRSFWLAGAWTSGRGTIRPGAGRSARCSPGWRIPRPTPDAAACGRLSSSFGPQRRELRLVSRYQHSRPRPHPNCGPT